MKLPDVLVSNHCSLVLYSLICTRQLHIFSIKPKLDMQVFVDFYVFTRFWLNLSDRNLKLFWTSKQNNFRFRSSKLSQKWVKTQKSTNNRISSFGLIEKNMELSHIFLAVTKKNYKGSWRSINTTHSHQRKWPFNSSFQNMNLNAKLRHCSFGLG